MAHGYVKFFDASRGFGFIRRKGDVDLFFHIRNVHSLNDDLEQDMPQTGDAVEFDVTINKKNQKPEGSNIFIRQHPKIPYGDSAVAIGSTKQ